MRSVALLALAACAPPPAPVDPALARHREIEALVGRLGDPAAERRTATFGTDAVPSLVRVLREDPAPERRGAAARVLGAIHRATRDGFALQSYVEAVKEASSAAVARELLSQAHHFPEPDVATLLLAYIEGMPQVPEGLVRSAAMMTRDEALGAMKAYVVRSKDAAADPARDLAIRYIGRAARAGRKDAVEFLVAAASGGEAGAVHAEAELVLVCGRWSPRNWRGWWLDRARERRADWLVQALSAGREKPFDPADRGAWAMLILSLDGSVDLEPEFALIGEAFRAHFGWVSPRDVFDPSASGELIREENERALERLRKWWGENGPYLYWDGAGWALNRKAREAGLAVDPKTGEPVAGGIAAVEAEVAELAGRGAFGEALGRLERAHREQPELCLKLEERRRALVEEAGRFAAGEIERAKGLGGAEARGALERALQGLGTAEDFAEPARALKRALGEE